MRQTHLIFWYETECYILYVLCTGHFIVTLNQTNKRTGLLSSITYIFNPYTCFGKWLAIFRGAVNTCNPLMTNPWRWQLICRNMCKGWKCILYLTIILCICWFDLNLRRLHVSAFLTKSKHVSVGSVIKYNLCLMDTHSGFHVANPKGWVTWDTPYFIYSQMVSHCLIINLPSKNVNIHWILPFFEI
jgi:hypothetical protein